MIKLTKNQYGFQLERSTNRVNEKTGYEIVEEMVDVNDLELYELAEDIVQKVGHKYPKIEHDCHASPEDGCAGCPQKDE